MNEHETTNNQKTPADTSASSAPIPTESPAAAPQTSTETSRKPVRLLGYVAAGLIVVIGLVAVVYLLEKEGRSSTGIFDSLLDRQLAGAVVATVNGEEIVNQDLDTSIRQFRQVADAQGVDTAAPEAQAEIRSQALEVLVNTKLLLQQASEEGFSVSDEEVDERLESIESEIGGADVLAERLNELGIDTDRLRSDVRDELLIQQLLDSLFESSEIVVTDDEIAGVYENAGGEEAGLPPLEEVRDQIIDQVQASKEQQVIDEYLGSVRATADIELR